MKKLLALLLAVAMVACLFAGCQSSNPDPTDPGTDPATEAPTFTTDPNAKKIAFVTDTGNIDDHSFNQYSYAGVTQYALDNGLIANYYKPAGDTDQDRIDAINQAIQDGHSIVTMAGFLFGPAVYQCALANPDVLFLALDVTVGDLKGADGNGVEEGNVPANLAMIVYKEEQCGYLAGYAAVVDGYKNLGFLGGVSVPAVVRYGYGFVQGADAAAKELNINDVTINYWYSNSFTPADEIATKMDSWYVAGTEVVFSCGGGIYLSCLTAADANDGKMIGVDVDQSPDSERIITSAMKALSNSVVVALNDAKANDYKWSATYAGKCVSLGAAEDCVGLPMETSKFVKFNQEKYDELFQSIVNGTLTIDDSCDVETHPATTNVTVNYQ